jgi:hypothetical protein
MKKHLCLCVGLLLLSMIGTVWADDIHPPSWRGNAGTTWAEWEFLNNNNTPNPDMGFLPYGPPAITVTPGPGAGWLDQNPPYNPPGVSGDGWWNLSGEIDLIMQDNPVLNPHKEIWIQLTWSPQVIGNVPILQVVDPFGQTPEFTNPLVNTTLYEQYPGLDIGEKVYHSVYHVDRIPNPPWERIFIRGGINVDELVVDTWCVPEPTTWLLLSTGGMLLLAVRRLRKRK